ncbi:protein Mis18-beta [Nelusetta ayraudi]|uniref:protein Mis18-beta n=1 Tax=Nelusetta ayraudi TaxID=303726 RepID=UPI003F706566
MEFDGSDLIRSSGQETKLSEAKCRHPMTLHCQQCNTVLGDSQGVCGEITCLDSIMCLKVTDDVVVSDLMETKVKGEMANCIYSRLKCRCCHSAVGTVIYSSPPRLASARSLFLLNRANISCYVLNSGSMVKASSLTFNLKPLKESIDELQQQVEAQLDLMVRLKS